MPSRVPSGVLAGGQFAATQHAEADVSLDPVEDFLVERRPQWQRGDIGSSAIYRGSTLGLTPAHDSGTAGPYHWNQVGPIGFTRGYEPSADEAMRAAERAARQSSPPVASEVTWAADESGAAMMATLTHDRFMAVEEMPDGSYAWTAGIADVDGSDTEDGWADEIEEAKQKAEAALDAHFPPPEPMSAEQLAQWGLDN